MVDTGGFLDNSAGFDTVPIPGGSGLCECVFRVAFLNVFISMSSANVF